MANNAYLIYYRKNKELVLTKQKNTTKIIKIDWVNKQEKNMMVCLKKKCTEQCLKKKKVKEMNTKETDIVKCLKNKKIKKENTQEIGITPW